MSVFSDTHIITKFDEEPIEITQRPNTLNLKVGFHSISMTLTPAQFLEIASACMAVADQIAKENAA